MKLHANARLSIKGRELLIARVEDARWSVMQAAEAAGITERTAHKWLGRYRAEGASGLLDRSSAPLRVANRTEERRVEAIAALRHLRMTGAEIGETLRDKRLRGASAPCSAAGPIARSTATAASTPKPCPAWIDFYNHRRPHGALHKPPIARLNKLNNLQAAPTCLQLTSRPAERKDCSNSRPQATKRCGESPNRCSNQDQPLDTFSQLAHPRRGASLRPSLPHWGDRSHRRRRAQ